MKNFPRRFFVSVLLISAIFVFPDFAQTPQKSIDLYQEVSNYVITRMREAAKSGERVTTELRDDFEREKKLLAAKYALTVAAISTPTPEDLFYLGMLYDAAGNETKTLETFQGFLKQLSPDADGDAAQIARTRVVVYASRKKQFDEMEKTYAALISRKTFNINQRPTLEGIMAGAYFRDGKYDQAIKYGESAFNLIKNLEAKTLAERRSKTETYSNLVELLVLSYKKADRKDDALNILAEGRALSFTIPSATLYRKVMSIVDASGLSEKKLMQKVESIKTAYPAPELTVKEWVGQDPTSLENLRGKVVLLDFWATWCGPCISTFPRLRDWHKKYGSNGLTIIGVTQFFGAGDQKPMTPLQELDFLRDFKEKYKMPYGIAVAANGEWAKYGISPIPTTVLLDRNGVVRYIGIGAGDEESANLEDMIKKVLKEQVLP